MLNNALNNNIALVKLSKIIGFEPMQKQLRYMGYILNLIAKLYIFKEDILAFEEDYKKALLGERQGLQRQRRKLRKLYNLVAHIIVFRKRINLFLALQVNANISYIKGKR